MLDKSIPYYGVLMLKKDLHNYPRFTTPAGYTIRFWRDPDDEEAWCALQTAAGQFDDLSQAHRRYQLEFAPYPRKLEQRMLFALDPMENPAATVTLWEGEIFGRTLLRIHWVATHPHHEGRGLAKTLLTKALDLYQQTGRQEPLYLATQTWSYPAIGLYQRLGFVPYLGEKPPHWEGTYAPEDGWRIIKEKLASYPSR